ncbi:YdcF family protein [Amycolatopsis magusensis]|uniref:YdcF family protein n=1 Tax=Amycolatopsis magusensis TaxID=882444 RepID=UPI003C2D81B5
MKRTVLLGFAALLGWGEVVHWRASRALVHPPKPARSEAVVVLGYRDRRGDRANALNRWRVRAALRSIDPALDSVLICSGAGAGPVSEAELMARYAVAECGYTGGVRLEDQSHSTWQNIRHLARLIGDADQVKIVSHPLHAQKARLYLHHQRPDLAARLVRGADYRPGEAFLLKPLLAAHGLRQLARGRRHLARIENRDPGYHEGMTGPEQQDEAFDERNAIEERAATRSVLLPEEQAAGSEDAEAQAKEVLRDSEHRVED